MNTRIVNGLTGTVALMVLFIGSGAFVLSYDALYQTGLTNGIPSNKAWIWPLLIDLPLIVFTLALLVSQLMRSSAKLWASLVILYTLATIGFNLSHAQQSILGYTVAIVAPIGLLLTTEALRHLAKSIIERQNIVSSMVELVAQYDGRQRELTILSNQITKANEQLAALKSDISTIQNDSNERFAQQMKDAKQAKMDARREQVLILASQEMTQESIAEQLNVSVATIRRDLQALNGQVAR